MHAQPTLVRVAVTSLLAAACLTGCSSPSGGTVASTSPGPTTSATDPGGGSATAATTQTTPDASGAVVPSTPSTLPDGIYRSHITHDELVKAGAEDQGETGTWTLTVRHSAYTMQCRAVSDPAVECGSSGKAGTAYIDAGWLRGGSTGTVWFVHDAARMLALLGCEPCGPMGGYRVSWKSGGTGVSFANWVGLGDEAGGMSPVNSLTLQPWTRIG